MDRITISSLTRGDRMLSREDVKTVTSLYNLGWGSRRIAKTLGVSRNTVKKYIKLKSWKPFKSPSRSHKLSDLSDWLKERFYTHRGNSAVVQEELFKTHGIAVSLRTVERALVKYRKDLKARAIATVRFETPAGKQLQIDFGTAEVTIGGLQQKVLLFVGTLSYSRRLYVSAFAHEKQDSWFTGLEGAFYHFEGIPEEVLIDNPKALVIKHKRSQQVIFNDKFKALAKYWGFTPKACAPYRARTKGKVERGVGYVKNNAIAGREFSSWQAFEQHLYNWMINTADERLHGTTHEKPIVRFQQEAQALRPLDGRPPFVQHRELLRKVHTDACIEVDTNRYSVPWHWIKHDVTVHLSDGQVTIWYGSEKIATHPECKGIKQQVINPSHLQGIIGSQKVLCSSLQRPLEDYASVVGGAW